MIGSLRSEEIFIFFHFLRSSCEENLEEVEKDSLVCEGKQYDEIDIMARYDAMKRKNEDELLLIFRKNDFRK